MTSWHSYPKIWNIGHGATAELFYEDVIVEEKVDGSQFSFGVFDGVLKLKSKNKELLEDAPDKMFAAAVAYVKSIKPQLVDGWTYRGEYLQKPKHNVLAYDRAPTNNIILFDVNTGEETYIDYETKATIAKSLGLECVPLLFQGKIMNALGLEQLLDSTSVLGGQKIEGFVVKNYKRFGQDKKALMGKFVSENFKEKHKVDWKEGNPGQNDILKRIIDQYRTPARWDKAIIHLRERGEIDGSLKDIGKLIQEVPADLISECGEEIKEQLYQWAAKDIMRGINRGLAEYYKERLLKEAFDK